MLRYLTAGESHGKGLVGIMEGLPAGLAISEDEIQADLARRQGGYGRGGRMKIETDRAEIISGVRWGLTLGSPLALMIKNKDWENWSEGMSAEAQHQGSIPAVTRPRPGHADLPGAQKYGHHDCRNILERSSARETAMRVALGAIARKLLASFGITIGGYVTGIGPSASSSPASRTETALRQMQADAQNSPVRCPDAEASARMTAAIDEAARAGDTLGGIFEVFALGLPVGLGSHVHWDRRLDGKLAQALMSIQAIKGVEVGIGFEAGRRPGSAVMDEIEQGFTRGSNNAGGIEGGMTNGMPLIVRAAMKPIPTLKTPLSSVDIASKEVVRAAYERSDVCAVPAASVIGEAMVALALAEVFVEKFGGDSIDEMSRNLDAYKKSLEVF